MKKSTKKAAISITLALSLALTLSACSHDHVFDGEWESDESNHWHVCQDGSCSEIADLAAHTGGAATESQKAVCEVCGHEYGEVASHEHQFGEWKTKTAATCTEDEVEYRVCACGEEETRTGDAKLGHDPVTGYDETSHWTVCSREGCDYETEKETHHGGTATETEQAVCEICGQHYGALKEAEKTAGTIAGTIADDTYVSSASSSAKDTNYIERETMGTYSNSFKVYLRFNFSDILANEDFAACKNDAKVQFSFTVVEGEISDTTTFTLKAYETTTASFGVDFSNITFNSVKGGDYSDIHWDNGAALVDKQPQGEVASYADGVITITLDYSAIEQYIDPTTGNALFAFATNTSGLKIASMENASAKPAVCCVYGE